MNIYLKISNLNEFPVTLILKKKGLIIYKIHKNNFSFKFTYFMSGKVREKKHIREDHSVISLKKIKKKIKDNIFNLIILLSNFINSKFY